MLLAHFIQGLTFCDAFPGLNTHIYAQEFAKYQVYMHVGLQN